MIAASEIFCPPVTVTFGDINGHGRTGLAIAVQDDGAGAELLPTGNDTTAKATPEIGDVERDGEHKGEIYGGIYPADNKPIWFLVAPKSMDHFNAATWAKGQGGSLPTIEQGQYIDAIKGNRALKDIFGGHSDRFSSAGYFWLAERSPGYRDTAWCLRFDDGDHEDYISLRNCDMSVLCVRR